MIPIRGVSRRSLPKEGDARYRSLRDYTNEELISYLNNNMTTDLQMMAGLMSEILRRMNEKSPLLTSEDEDWGSPIVP